MYKFKIINYKPYEYEILQHQLDQLGKDGYYTDDLSFVSIFKKVNHPIYYKIDFFKQTGKTRTEKNNLKDAFCDPYLEYNYQPIYNKNGMYVFVGETEFDINIKWNQKENYIDEKKRYQPIGYMLSTLLVLICLLVAPFYSTTIDVFLTYGTAISYLGLILLCMTCFYRHACSFYFYSQFYQMIHKKINVLKISLLSKLRFFYKMSFIISVILIIGGLTEDIFNTQDLTKNECNILTFEDLGIKEKTEFSAKKKTGFFVSPYYTSIELTEHDVLYTKQYHFHSSKQAENKLDKIINHPENYDCTHFSAHDLAYYGYVDEQLTTLVIPHQNTITIVNFVFDYTNDNLNAIIQYYK